MLFSGVHMAKFPFDDDVKKAARIRQRGICAKCGKALIDDLDDPFRAQAHHVIPQQSGVESNPSHAWMETVENCVIICYDEHLHAAHGGNFESGPVAPPEEFPYSHGNDKVRHAEWVRSLKLKADSVWGPKLSVAKSH
jgi:hypothetical protein